MINTDRHEWYEGLPFRYLLYLVLGVTGCSSGADSAAKPWFQDVTNESGVDFTYRSGKEAGHNAILEVMGGGVALLDYDGDGLLDIFLAGGGYFDGPDKKEIRGHPNRLYRNLGKWRFQDVTAEAGLDQPLFYSHGCAVADYDRDGWPDLLVTGWGRVALYHNEPDGKGGRRFVEVTAKAGLTDTMWSTSAAWGDLDGDGFPDLYICHYVDWSFNNNPECQHHLPSVLKTLKHFPKAQKKGGVLHVDDVCPPQRFKPLLHSLYRNNGNGTFSDVSQAAGLYQKNVRANSKGLGVLIADVNGDGRPDIYVANDSTDKFLYLNCDRWRLHEVGLDAGVARDDRGKPNSSMGVDCADYDGSGRPSLWVTNFTGETHALYRNEGRELFTHRTHSSGIAAIGTNYVGFGTGFLDVENKGWEDLVITNGHVMYHAPGTPFRQQPVLLRNLGGGRFAAATKEGGAYFDEKHVGRGLAIGDLDNDGRPDLIISHLDEPVALLRNEAPAANWLGVELIGRENRDIVGAKVTLEVRGRVLTRFAKGGGSYLSSGDRRLLFGLGRNNQPGRLTVNWPVGTEPRVQHFDGLTAGKYHRLIQGRDDNVFAQPFGKAAGSQ